MSHPPAVSSRHTVSRAGAPIRLERLTISQTVREAIERQFLAIAPDATTNSREPGLRPPR
jgi:hypothetical protein